ncbi:MAG: YciI family protein [Hoeflea sp.]|uniref:YciI family protein n=1 Tax=Hoeflea sp. TaxID=1940281 RepID=UPI003EF2527C
MAFLEDGEHLFIVDLTYITALETVDQLVNSHMAFIDRCYASGLFLASGAKLPRTGGIIIARGRTMADIEALITGDPFHMAGVAKYRITEFDPVNVAAALK